LNNTKSILDSLIIGIFSFFLGVNTAAQFTDNRVIMFITGMITSGIVVLDLGNSQFINKVREFIHVVGTSSMIFAASLGTYIYQNAFPKAEAATYFVLVTGHLAIQVFIVSASVAILLLQVYFSFLKNKRSLKKK